MDSPTNKKPQKRQRSFNLIRAAKQWCNYYAGRKDLLAGIVLVVLAGLCLEVLAAAIDHVVERVLDNQPVKGGDWRFIAVSFGLTLFLALVIWWCRHVFRTPYVRYWIASAGSPRPYLVIFLSQQQVFKGISEIPESGPIVIDGATLRRVDLMEDARAIEKTGRPWPWEMVLRGIAPHLRCLRRVYLVGSADSENGDESRAGTFRQLEMLKRFLLPYLAANRGADLSGVEHMAVMWNEPVDFESFDKVHETLESIRNRLIEESAEDSELCVDITGGMNHTVAGAGWPKGIGEMGRRLFRR